MLQRQKSWSWAGEHCHVLLNLPGNQQGITKAMNRRKIVLWLVFLGVLLSAPAWSWDPTELPPGFVVETPGSPVELDGETLFLLK
jgi:hypothetical protein